MKPKSEQSKPEPNKARQAVQLPIVTINGRRYFVDERLGEMRAVDNPHVRRPL